MHLCIHGILILMSCYHMLLAVVDPAEVDSGTAGFVFPWVERIECQSAERQIEPTKISRRTNSNHEIFALTKPSHWIPVP